MIREAILLEKYWKNSIASFSLPIKKKEEYREVENLVRESFWNVYRPGCLEHYVLNQLRKDPNFVAELDFVMIDNGKLSVAKVTFGAEPKDYELQEFIIRHYYHLKFSPSVDVKVKQDAVNPKRRQREARKQSQSSGIGTKSQQALQLQREENELERKVISREMKEAEKQKQFDLKQQKRKEKHRGR